MDQRDQDRLTLLAMLEQTNHWDFPRASSIQVRLARGETLTDSDLHFFHYVIDNAKTTFPLIERNPDYQELTNKGLAFYNDLLQRAIDNELALTPGLLNK